MDINWNLHPQEIVRKLKCFYRDSLLDFELRHPETRRRLALELKFKLNSQDRLKFQALIKRFESAKAVISVFDWPILLEWNEYRLLCESIYELEWRLENFRGPLGTSLLEIFRRRMLEILSEMRALPYLEDPSFFTCVSLRWRFSALRQEAAYYCERWDQLQPPEAIAS